MDEQSIAAAEPDGSSRARSRVVTWCFWWFAATPLVLLGIEAVDRTRRVPDELLLTVAAILGISQLLAFLTAAVGGFLIVDAQGRRRWLTGVAAIALFLCYLLATLSRMQL